MKVVFDTTSPYVGRVILYEETWTEKIVVGHPELTGKVDDVQATVEDPTHIIESATTEGNYLLVNTNIADNTGSRYMRVPVAPRSDFFEVRSSYYSSNITQAGTIVWKK